MDATMVAGSPTRGCHPGPANGSLAVHRIPPTQSGRYRGRDPVMRKSASIVGLVFGAIFVVAGIVTWIVITSTLSSQKITVSDDASCRTGAAVAGPISAYCQASVIDKHTMEITSGKTYAELDRDDPNRNTAMTSSFLQASRLHLRSVAFGVAAMADGRRHRLRQAPPDLPCASRTSLLRGAARSGRGGSAGTERGCTRCQAARTPEAPPRQPCHRPRYSQLITRPLRGPARPAPLESEQHEGHADGYGIEAHADRYARRHAGRATQDRSRARQHSSLSPNLRRRDDDRWT